MSRQEKQEYLRRGEELASLATRRQAAGDATAASLWRKAAGYYREAGDRHSAGLCGSAAKGLGR